MKNGDIAEVFRVAARVLEMSPDDDTVFLDQKASVLTLTHPVVGRLTFEMHPRFTPAMSEQRLEEIRIAYFAE